ncbi:hypothetical protein LUZ62_033610 [Rhynchospora pubera]|uniref:SHSP domain-containing protein n=1 Tax=Rhynchospora pubera TaxID=906938 RepID=A0AAV8C303_9POAL|nr:hypothetical protein LUZ62_084232 [Rhynchospora pubera]KAJ4797254.1 hypothetical protein LUZ62_048500 [Rhynchospora pubera]KAJ4821044.1 hypothetical protein LUZ62_033610 [Rhynchospora pubera]
MATRQFKKNELKFEDFEPVTELQEVHDKFIFLVNLPGFRKEDFRVQVDALGKLSVKGQKKIDDNRCKRFNSVFQLPPDSDIEKIRGKFEGDVLTLTLPKREKPLPSKQEIKSSTEEAEAKLKDGTKASEKKEEETKPKEEPQQTSEKKEEEVKPKEAETDKKDEELATANGEKREEIARGKEETNMPEIKEAASRIGKGKEETNMPEIKEAASRINEEIKKWKKDSSSSGGKKEETMKRSEEEKIVSWKKRICQEAKAWSDYASVDNMLETINRNRNEIAIAVAAFSIGFLVCRKLSSRN